MKSQKIRQSLNLELPILILADIRKSRIMVALYESITVVLLGRLGKWDIKHLIPEEAIFGAS